MFKLVSPWVNYYRQIEALFSEDEDIKIVYDEDENEVKLYVRNAEKAAALTELLPVAKEFGNVKLLITVVPANNKFATRSWTIADAFAGNPIVNSINTIHGIMSNDITYVIFRKEVVQYYNDDLSDAHGVCSTLYEILAKEILGEMEGVYFCTDVNEIDYWKEDDKLSLGTPLGEWP